MSRCGCNVSRAFAAPCHANIATLCTPDLASPPCFRPKGHRACIPFFRLASSLLGSQHSAQVTFPKSMARQASVCCCFIFAFHGLAWASEHRALSSPRTRYNLCWKVQALDAGDQAPMLDADANSASGDTDSGGDDAGAIDMGLTPERGPRRAAAYASAAGPQPSVTSPSALDFDGRPLAQRTAPASATTPAPDLDPPSRPRRAAAAKVPDIPFSSCHFATDKSFHHGRQALQLRNCDVGTGKQPHHRTSMLR